MKRQCCGTSQLFSPVLCYDFKRVCIFMFYRLVLISMHVAKNSSSPFRNTLILCHCELLTLGAHAQRGLRKLGLYVCLSVCPCFNSLLDCLFVPQMIRSTERVTISLIEPFFLDMLRCRDLSAASLVRIQSAIFTPRHTRVHITIYAHAPYRLTTLCKQ